MSRELAVASYYTPPTGDLLSAELAGFWISLPHARRRDGAQTPPAGVEHDIWRCGECDVSSYLLEAAPFCVGGVALVAAHEADRGPYHFAIV